MVPIRIKQKGLEAVQQLPPDATVEDACETLPHEAARKRLLK